MRINLKENKMANFLNYSDIAARLEIKAPWRLLDFAEQKDDTHFTGFKLMAVNEAFFVGHFPNHPILPGVLQLEAIRQLCVLFAPGKAADWRILRVDKVKFRRPVLPGDRMRVDAELTSDADGVLVFKAATSSAAGVCSEALITLGKAEPLKAVTAIPAEWNEFDRTDKSEMDINKVLELMPHRYPFLFIDYICKTEESKVWAVKNVTYNENFFDAGFGVFPEVLLCETAAQTGCANVLSKPENAGKLGFFMAIDNAVFYRQIQPGEQMVFVSDLPAGKSRFGRGGGKVYVGDEVVFEISLMFAIVDA